MILILTVWSWEFKRQNNINISEQQQHRMQQLQQTVFSNFSKNTLYYQDSKVIAQKHEPFPKFRQQQILNEFELVDLHNKGKLGQTDIITYLSNKYQWINTNILGQLFKTMAWDPLDHTVTKQQFVSKYLSRQKKLYLDINGLKNYQNWMRTLQQIYINEMRISNPRVYFYVQVRGVNIYENSKHIQWMDLIVEYQDHQTRTNYEIEQALYNGNYPSFEIWLPARNNTFFLKFTFADSNNRQYVYGQAYFEKPIEERISRFQNIDLMIVKNGVKFGDCQVCVYAQPSMQKVGRELKQLRQKEHINFELVNEKVKQYEYLQFLWGIRHKYPHKISPLDVSWMLAVRMILLILIGVLGVVVHVLGRFQPLSIIITFLMLRSWEFVLLRHQKFFLLWITVASILLDIAWISISSGFDSQITYTNNSLPVIVTYFLLGLKVILFAYLTVVERSLTED